MKGKGVTGNELSPEAKRQKDRRDRLAAEGIKEVEVPLGPIERANLEYARQARAGTGEAYSVREYIATLIRRDAEQLARDIARLEGYECRECGKVLPKGCGGLWTIDSPCALRMMDKFIQL